MTTDDRWLGATLALTSAALFGVSTPLAKVLLGEISPWMLAGLLYTGSGFGLFGFEASRRLLGRPAVEAPLRRRELPWLAGAILAGGVAGPVLLMFGLASTPASSAALLLTLEGLATMTIAWMVFRESTDLRIVVGAMAILAGAALLSWQGGPMGISAGSLAIVAACLAWGADNNLTRKISNADPVRIAAIKGLVAGGVNLALALALGAHLPAWPLLAGAGLVGLFGYGVSLILFVLALRHVGAARTGAYFSLAPFVGAAVAILFLAEPVTLQLAGAAALMGLGLYLHLAERHDHWHEHEALEHEHAHVHDEHHRHGHAPGDPGGEPHAHRHRHAPLAHKHPHFPDLHHGHRHG